MPTTRPASRPWRCTCTRAGTTSASARSISRASPAPPPRPTGSPARSRPPRLIRYRAIDDDPLGDPRHARAAVDERVELRALDGPRERHGHGPAVQASVAGGRVAVPAAPAHVAQPQPRTIAAQDDPP